MDYAERERREARIIILQLLEDAGGYRGNVPMLRGLLDQWGLVVSTDWVEGEAAWLAEQGLVTTEKAGPLTVLTATVRGLEVAQGIARHPGVERPKPKG